MVDGGGQGGEGFDWGVSYGLEFHLKYTSERLGWVGDKGRFVPHVKRVVFYDIISNSFFIHSQAHELELLLLISSTAIVFDLITLQFL